MCIYLMHGSGARFLVAVTAAAMAIFILLLVLLLLFLSFTTDATATATPRDLALDLVNKPFLPLTLSVAPVLLLVVPTLRNIRKTTLK